MIFKRIQGRYRRTVARYLCRRPLLMKNAEPLISFTFDDFPRSALFTAGPILEKHGIAGTYYTSFGLMGQTAPTGEIFHREDLPQLFDRGHELGCHTFAHCHAGDTSSDDFERSVVENQQARKNFTPTARFESLSYPISLPRPSIKRKMTGHFRAARGGGQTFNIGTIDLNNLSAFFLEQSRDDLEAVKAMVDSTCRAGGWLIFATHDVANAPTRYGVSPEFFENIVHYSIKSGARILPVSAALNAIGA